MNFCLSEIPLKQYYLFTYYLSIFDLHEIIFKNKNTCAYLTPSNKSERGKNTHTMYLYKFPDKSFLKEVEVIVFENIHILF